MAKKQRSALDLMTAASDATKVSIPERGNYKGATFPIMSEEERKILFKMMDDMGMSSGPHIYYKPSSEWNDEFTKGEYLPLGTILINEDYVPRSRAMTVSHELMHHAAYNALNNDRKFWYDSVASTGDGNTWLSQAFDLGSTEPMAYRMANNTTAGLDSDSLYARFAREIKENIYNKNNAVSVGLKNLFELMTGGSK